MSGIPGSLRKLDADELGDVVYIWRYTLHPVRVTFLASLLVTFLGWLSDLQLGDEKVTLNHLVFDYSIFGLGNPYKPSIWWLLLGGGVDQMYTL